MKQKITQNCIRADCRIIPDNNHEYCLVNNNCENGFNSFVYGIDFLSKLRKDQASLLTIANADEMDVVEAVKTE